MRVRSIGVAVALGALSASPLAEAVTLEELAARMEKLEKKVAAYEAKYGPLENPKSAPAPAKVAQRPQTAGEIAHVAANAPKGGLVMIKEARKQ